MREKLNKTFRLSKSFLKTKNLGISIIAILGLSLSSSFGQGRIVLDGEITIKLDGGSESNPIYLIVDNNNSNALTQNGDGYLRSENQFNVLRWNIKNGTGFYEVPFGDDNASILPVSLNITSPGSIDGYVDFSTYPTGVDNLPMPAGVSSLEHVDILGDGLSAPPADGAKLYDRYWFVNANSYNTQPTGSIKFNYHSAAMTGDLVSGITPLSAQYHNGIGWVIDQFGLDDLAGSVSGIPVTDGAFHSTFVLVQNGYPLPITLLSFNAVWKNEEQSIARVFWSTASELNNDYFIVQRSSDGVNWANLEQIDGAGNSINTINYHIFDNRPLNGVSYYRLKQVDFDGTSTYSNVVSLRKDITAPMLEVYPNPSSAEFNIYFSGFDADVVDVKIMDNSGRLVYSFNPNILNNPQQVVDSRNFESGIYHIQVTSGETRLTQKIVIRN